ncbi:biotin-dependent carboxyltransferase family protein [Paenibacillus lutrae]|uniref:5-oxoprolinase/urea amidolyase family protein n=1 Tax=Paenibacillus lutrae TaxID=2078573 RepID=A0A7X3FG13_9BACL|nr:biotin-dependent carboxyltransferase family protein [Paenibacillus lutrae]MVO98922.1 5-oxoprolinase/urea amidolyase family protein [Paenibacillus lutrae]
MALLVNQAGLYTTVQDQGRTGLRRYGMVQSGAMDRRSARIANMLVGNPPDAAVLEWTLRGPKLTVGRDMLMAFCGAQSVIKADGHPVNGWQAVYIPAGTVLDLGNASEGCRGYLAAAGGIDVPEVMGSRSTYVRAALGGLEGRPLAAGDRLPIGEPGPTADRMLGLLAADGRSERAAAALPAGPAVKAAPWSVSHSLRPASAKAAVLRMVRGHEADRFVPGPHGLAGLLGGVYRVLPQSDRMGCRLLGAQLKLVERTQMVSESVVPGTIQVPPDGQPIVLGADSQTTGGYPRIGHVISADLPILAQLPPGASVRFSEVTLEEAHAAITREETDLRRLEAALHMRMVRIGRGSVS